MCSMSTRSETITIRVSPEEKKQIEEDAAFYSLKPADFIRKRVFDIKYSTISHEVIDRLNAVELAVKKIKE